MGFQIDGPHIVAFLEFVSKHYPDARSFEDFDRRLMQRLQEQYVQSIPTHVVRNSDALKALVEGGFSRLKGSDYSYVERQSFFRSRLNADRERTDALEKYLAAEYRGIFLYAPQDHEFIDFFRQNWTSLDIESGSMLHFFDYGLDYGIDSKHSTRARMAYTYAEDYIRSLWPIPGADLKSIRAVGLPCLLLWNKEHDSVLVPFADVLDDPSGIRYRIRLVLRHLNEGQLIGIKTELGPQTAALASETADVFISYQHSDRSWVQGLAQTFRQAGYEPWYDQDISVGERWNLKIADMISKAKAVVVVWSNSSIGSEYVQAEAHRARELKKLFPVFKERPLELPVPFNIFQTSDMSNWNYGQGLPRELASALSSAIPVQPNML